MDQGVFIFIQDVIVEHEPSLFKDITQMLQPKVEVEGDPAEVGGGLQHPLHQHLVHHLQLPDLLLCQPQPALGGGQHGAQEDAVPEDDSSLKVILSENY